MKTDILRTDGVVQKYATKGPYFIALKMAPYSVPVLLKRNTLREIAEIRKKLGHLEVKMNRRGFQI